MCLNFSSVHNNRKFYSIRADGARGVDKNCQGAGNVLLQNDQISWFLQNVKYQQSLIPV